jgi:hypothetical protein
VQQAGLSRVDEVIRSMALSTDVTLPRSQLPVFPDNCVSCGLPAPGGHIRLTTHSIGWWTWVFWLHGSRFAVNVPACEPCRRAMIRQRWAREVTCWLFVLVGVLVAVYVLGSLRGPLKRWLALGIALLCMAPWFAWELFFPRPIDLTAHAKTVDYEFRDEAYAEAFAELNG